MGNTRDHLEAGGVGSSHLCVVLQSDGAGGALVWSREVGYINLHEEAVSKGTYVFLRQVMRKQVKRSLDETWKKWGTESELKAAVTQDVRPYIDRIQVVVAHWATLWPIFEVCAQQETGYESGRRRRPPWWRQMAADAQLRVTLEDIL